MPQSGLTRRAAMAGGTAIAGIALRSARAEAMPVRVGVLTDENSYASSSGGAGAIIAARMAAADFGPTVLGQPIEILHGDTQNKPDISSTTARAWFDQGVDAIVDLPATGVAAAAAQIAAEKNKIAMITSAASLEFTTKWCKPTTIMWQDDTHAMAAGSAIPAVRAGGRNWYFITLDTEFGVSLQDQITEVVRAGGGSILGSARCAAADSDYSAQILKAQTSGAQVLGLCCVRDGLVSLIKQAHEFGVTPRQQLTTFLIELTDIHALGAKTAQGLAFSSSFYWNQNDSSRGFANRFFAAHKAMPTREQAQVYAATTHFLKSMARAGSRDTQAVRRAMSALPPEYFGHAARVREDGRVLFDVTRYRVRAPAEIRTPWDYYEAAGTLHAEDAFLPMEGRCKFV